MLLQHVHDLNGCGDGRLNIVPRDELEVLHHVQVQGIGHGHIENAVLQADGKAEKLREISSGMVSITLEEFQNSSGRRRES